MAHTKAQVVIGFCFVSRDNADTFGAEELFRKKFQAHIDSGQIQVLSDGHSLRLDDEQGIIVFAASNGYDGVLMVEVFPSPDNNGWTQFNVHLVNDQGFDSLSFIPADSLESLSEGLEELEVFQDVDKFLKGK
jgi:hypothetical protein